MTTVAVERKTDAEYARQGDAALELMIDYVKDENGWNLVKSAKQNNGVKVERRRAPANDMDIFMASIDLENASVGKVLALVLPWLPYRAQWDELLESVHVVEKLTPTRSIVQHLTKAMMPLSSRESVDVVQVCKRDGSIYVAATDTEHPRTPVGANGNKYVRTVQHLGGYAIIPIDDHGCRFMMVFHADLNLPAAKLISGIVDWVKPKLMTDKLLCLQKAITKISIDQDIIDSVAVEDMQKPITKTSVDQDNNSNGVADLQKVNSNGVADLQKAIKKTAIDQDIIDSVVAEDLQKAVTKKSIDHDIVDSIAVSD